MPKGVFDGVGVRLGIGVRDGVNVTVGVSEAVGVWVGSAVSVGVLLTVAVGVGLGVALGIGEGRPSVACGLGPSTVAPAVVPRAAVGEGTMAAAISPSSPISCSGKLMPTRGPYAAAARVRPAAKAREASPKKAFDSRPAQRCERLRATSDFLATCRSPRNSSTERERLLLSRLGGAKPSEGAQEWDRGRVSTWPGRSPEEGSRPGFGHSQCLPGRSR